MPNCKNLIPRSSRNFIFCSGYSSRISVLAYIYPDELKDGMMHALLHYHLQDTLQLELFKEPKVLLFWKGTSINVLTHHVKVLWRNKGFFEYLLIVLCHVRPTGKPQWLNGRRQWRVGQCCCRLWRRTYCCCCIRCCLCSRCCLIVIHRRRNLGSNWSRADNWRLTTAFPHPLPTLLVNPSSLFLNRQINWTCLYRYHKVNTCLSVKDVVWTAIDITWCLRPWWHCDLVLS